PLARGLRRLALRRIRRAGRRSCRDGATSPRRSDPPACAGIARSFARVARPSPNARTMSRLFQPLQQRGLVLRNRIAVSPMCQYSSVDGMPGDWHLVHLGSRAVGGAAVVFTEASAVSPEGRISPEDAGIWNDAQAEAWARIARFIDGQGAVPAM